MKQRIIQLLPFGILLLGVSAAGWILFAPKSNTSTSVASLSSCQQANEFKCYTTYFEEKTKATDSVQAFAELRSIYETDAYAKSQCHQFAHAIGHAAYEKYGSLPTAFSKGDSFCWSGYHHGVTEKAVGKLGAERIKSEANTLCSELAASNRYSFDHYNCAHGLGHGFLTVDNFQLFDALKTCDLLKDNWERESCYGGVFMENVMVVSRGGTSAYLKPTEPMYPCTAVESAYKYQCYLMQTSYALQKNGYDFGKAFQLCRDIPDSTFVATCYQSIGRDASGSTTSDITRTKANCDKALDGTGLENCMLGAVRDFISYHHSDTQAKELCKAFGTSLEPRCLQEVASYYKTF